MDNAVIWVFLLVSATAAICCWLCFCTRSRTRPHIMRFFLSVFLYLLLHGLVTVAVLLVIAHVLKLAEPSKSWKRGNSDKVVLVRVCVCVLCMVVEHGNLRRYIQIWTMLLLS